MIVDTPKQALQLVKELLHLQFPEHLFRKIHPRGHTIDKYRGYCEARTYFTANSSSHELCMRMAFVVEQARKSSDALDGAAWERLVGDALRQYPHSGKNSTLSGTRASYAGQYHRLDPHHQRFIAEQIANLVPVALDTNHTMQHVARWQIKNTLWRWTVDGVDANGIAQIDAAKRCPDLLPMTRLANEAIASNSDDPGLKRIHEHVVPRKVITRHLLECDARTADDVLEVLRSHCFAAVVTKTDEKRYLGLRNAMPSGWRWGDDRWARYKHARYEGAYLYDQLVWLADWPDDLR